MCLVAVSSSLLFLKKFIYNPGQIGSVFPSSMLLAKAMTDPIPWEQVQAVAELGSGTGAITRLIESNLCQPADVFLFEKDDVMRANLQRQYAHFKCCSNASQLLNVIQQNGIKQLDCIISGLPFFNFPKQQRDVLMDQIVRSLKPGGYFVAFQYSLQMKKQLNDMLELESIKFVPLNIPPAFVYICRKT
ncbi:class I SAM-dependent methyltransferase [Paenibacillus thalictri]|uniref:Methyltransferase domain-containing protein n=1 Tax=Paenibacillus thalictri TaxID=2527873 RepID=A0A4Q9DSX5_9BACL|nr:methyltransferase domain-containing protein [Paenibacillus thalictri]TBL78599.1 methyltransferase domain-containing protein [Paenibacillus thalictri]